MTRLFTAVVAILASALPASASAQNALTSAQAQAIIQGCVEHAIERGEKYGITVVDAGGNMVAALRMDGRSWGPQAFSKEKAQAAAAWGFSTSSMERGAQNTQGFADAPAVVTVKGGVPIYDKDGILLGGAGASGEAAVKDEACITAGVKSAGLFPAKP